MSIISDKTLLKIRYIAKHASGYVGSDDPDYIQSVEDGIKNQIEDLVKEELIHQKDEILKLKNQEMQFNPIDSFNEYQKIAMTTKSYGSGLPVFYPAIKLGGEAGEVLEKIGKAWRDANGHFDEDRIKGIKMECGDVLWYITAIADDLDFNLIDVANSNIAKIIDRRARKVVSGDGDYR